MRLLLLILSVFCISAFGYTKIEKMSLDQATSTLQLMDEIDQTNNDTLKVKFKELTDQEYDKSLRKTVYEIIHKNANNTSFFMKVAGLVTFQNVIILCMIGVAIGFIVSLFKDIIFVLGAIGVGFALMLLTLLLNKKFMYSVSIFVSSVVMYFKPDEIHNVYLRYLFIFDWLTPLFGCIIFGITSFMIYDDLIREGSRDNRSTGLRHGGYNNQNSYIGVGLFITWVWAIVASYHQNWLVGVATVMMLFFSFGFLFGPIFGGYAVGYDNDESLIRCGLISLVLNAFMIGVKCGFITGPVLAYIKVFETGVYFWGSFVGCLAMLIQCDEWYISYRRRHSGADSSGYYMLMQMMMGAYCLTMMYVGSVLYISCFKSIGGTFLVLWSLDLEQTFLRKIGSGNITVALGVILANLWFLKQLISWYPEYCIF